MGSRFLGMASIEGKSKPDFLYSATLAMMSYYRGIRGGKQELLDGPFKFEVHPETLEQFEIKQETLFGARLVPDTSTPKGNICYGDDKCIS